MKAAADWRLALVAGGALGLAASPFWIPGGSWVKPLLALVFALAALAERQKVSGPAILLIGVAAALAGLLVGGARLAAIDGEALQGAAGPVILTGFATESPSNSRGTARFAFDSGRGRVLVEAAPGEAAEVRPGVGLEVSGRLEPAPGWMSSDLRRRGIGMTLRAERILPNGSGREGVTGWIDRLRERAFAALEVAVPDREAALSRGFVLGDKSDIDPRTVEDFRRSGLSHLLAVSGQNIVLLALLATPFLALLGVGPGARLPVIAALILIYVPLAGGGPSIQRAGVMGIAGLVALAATRAPSRIYALGLAAMITLALNPRASGDIGWQLSFAAVAGIMLLARPLQARLEPLIGTSGWRRIACEGIAVTLAATIATAPLTVLHFERLPVATLLANLAAMPAVAPAMWLGMVSIAVGQLSPALAVPFNLAGSVCLGWIAQVAEWFGRPGWAVAELRLGTPALVASSLALGSVSLVLLRFWKVGPGPVRAGRWLPAAGALLLTLILVVPGLAGEDRRELDAPPAGGARVEILDVGQGDAILIRPAGQDPILIDGGPPGGGLVGALGSARVERLAAVLLTHPDLDHFGGLLDVFGLIPVERFLYDRAPPELISMVRRSGTELDRVAAGEEISDGNLGLEILGPSLEKDPAPGSNDETETNLRSIVALLEWRDFRMLLPGDAEAESVPIHPGPIDVLKVSHHGSEDAGLPGLLDESQPRVAVISVGEENRYGHPVPDVLGELSADLIQTFRTDHDGTVSIVVGPGPGFRVETGR